MSLSAKDSVRLLSSRATGGPGEVINRLLPCFPDLSAQVTYFNPKESQTALWYPYPQQWNLGGLAGAGKGVAAVDLHF